jgi:hypothetical protein
MPSASMTRRVVARYVPAFRARFEYGGQSGEGGAQDLLRNSGGCLLRLAGNEQPGESDNGHQPTMADG